jgi:hypothetical protein
MPKSANGRPAFPVLPTSEASFGAVAQTALSAVSPTAQSANRAPTLLPVRSQPASPPHLSFRRLGNLRDSRLGSLRYSYNRADSDAALGGDGVFFA